MINQIVQCNMKVPVTQVTSVSNTSTLLDCFNPEVLICFTSSTKILPALGNNHFQNANLIVGRA